MRTKLESLLLYTPVLVLGCAAEASDSAGPPVAVLGDSGWEVDAGSGGAVNGAGGSAETTGGAAGAVTGGAGGDDAALDAGSDAESVGEQDGGSIDASDEPGSVSGSCPAGKFLVGVSNGQLVCTSLAAAIRSYVNTNCSLYWGWKDDCNGCQNDPQRWGRVNDVSCTNSGWGGNTCAKVTLGNESVRLFGLNPSGDVDGNDKLYVGMVCKPAASSSVGQCPAGQFAIGITSSGSVQCAAITSAARNTVNQQCHLYAGWRDDCLSNSCLTPTRWGRVSGDACSAPGIGPDSCTAPTLETEPVRLFGLNPDGDVDYNDKLFLGMKCSGIDSATTGDCSAGQLVVGISDGKVQCASIAGALGSYVSDKCSVYFGWKDDCDACTSPPAKWGRVNQNGCKNGAGADDTCTTASLNGEIVRMFGLNPDGDVDGNDKLYYGFRCE